MKIGEVIEARAALRALLPAAKSLALLMEIAHGLEDLRAVGEAWDSAYQQRHRDITMKHAKRDINDNPVVAPDTGGFEVADPSAFNAAMAAFVDELAIEREKDASVTPHKIALATLTAEGAFVPSETANAGVPVLLATGMLE